MDSIDRGDGVFLAYAFRPGRAPTLVFLPGFMSHMGGDKATMLAGLAHAHGNACLRLDYAGHGASGGRFEDGTIGGWTQDALCLIDRLTAGPLVVVGSSMGGWIGLLVALARPARVAAYVGIAAAPDFTEELVWPSFSAEARGTILREGVLRIPNPDGSAQVFTRALIEEGRAHLLLGGPIALACKVRLLHGQQDDAVPWQTALRLAERIEGRDVQVTLVKDAGHRLSRPQDLAVLRDLVAPLLAPFRGQDGA